ncbi:MAG TPA: thiaminase II [Acetobacteraceae bacterium]|jgi:thiaminase/transcriptional activator TenA|nr:thiaminase II [Acetobacteraceae bacterium]
MTDHTLPLDHGLFGRLRRDAGAVWIGYVAHDFVHALGRGNLPQPAFRQFLVQDYLFLIHFARAHALAGFKATHLDDIRAAAKAVSAIVDLEMPLHVAYCAGWGLTEEHMASAPEAMETTAYTRFVLERGLAGDLLDLQVALAPCLVGYGESGERLLADPAMRREGNPYEAWIAAYTSDAYRGAVRDAIAMLERLGEARGAAARYPELLDTFVAATRLETAFWDMGWRAGSGQVGR